MRVAASDDRTSRLQAKHPSVLQVLTGESHEMDISRNSIIASTETFRGKYFASAYVLSPIS